MAEDPRNTPGRPGAERGFYGTVSYTPEESTSQFSDAQVAHLAGIRNYAGTPEQQAQIAQWRAQQSQDFLNRSAETALERMQNPDAMAPGQSSNYLARSADGSRTVAYGADPARLNQQDFSLAGFGRQVQGFRDAGSDIGRFAAGTQQRGDLANVQQSRQMLLSDLSRQGPSAAEAQLYAGQDAAARNAVAIARSGRGMGGAGAMRQALQQSAEGYGQANQQAAILRAQESAQRTQQLAQLGQMDRSGLAQADQSYLAGRQAQLGAQQQLAGLTQAQQQAQADRAKTQMAADVGVNLQNAQFANYRDPPKDNAGAVAGAIGAGLGAAAMMISDIRAKRDIAPLASVEAAPGPNTFGSGWSREDVARLGGGLSTSAQPLINGIAYDSAQAAQPVMIPPMLKPLELSDENSKREIERLRRERDEWQFRATGNIGEDIGRKVGRDNQQAARDTEHAARIAGGIPGQAASLASLAATPGYSYRYKEGEGEDPSTRHVGPMAQDLERTPVGQSVVQTLPDGRKAIDAGRLALVNATATGDLARRQAELERSVTSRDPARALAMRRARSLADMGDY